MVMLYSLDSDKFSTTKDASFVINGTLDVVLDVVLFNKMLYCHATWLASKQLLKPSDGTYRYEYNYNCADETYNSD